MGVLQANGVVVGKHWDKREYTTEDGKLETMDLIRVNVADINGAGQPLELEVTKEQYGMVALWKTYSFPVEARTFNTRAGAAMLSFRVRRDFDISKGLQANAPAPPITK